LIARERLTDDERIWIGFAITLEMRRNTESNMLFMSAFQKSEATQMSIWQGKEERGYEVKLRS
jgi:hypothetical protein